MMDKVELYFKYRCFDMILNVIDFTVDGDGDVDISEYSIEFDYTVAEGHPHPADETMKMFAAMLQDGDHLQEKIMCSISEDEQEKIKESLREAYSDFWSEQEDIRGDHEFDLRRDEGL